MLFIWDAVNSPMVAAVLGTAPCKSLIIKLRDVAEDPAGDKVVLHEADEPFDFLSEHSEKNRAYV